MADREGPVQAGIVKYLRAVLPPECIVHFAKGEINKRGKAFMIEQARATRLGACKGFPDLVVIPYATAGVFFLECKAEGNYATPEQKAMHERLRSLGYRVAVVRSVDDVREKLREWGIGHREL